MTLEEAKKIIKSECYIADLLNLDRTRMVNTALDTVIEVAEQTRWIPVTERLPEDYIHVLCQFTLNGMGECYLAHGVFHVVGGLVMTCNEVIAWRELPQPYKAEEEKPIKAKKAIDIMHDVINAENIPYEGTDDR
jgi:hypothetical protein